MNSVDNHPTSSTGAGSAIPAYLGAFIFLGIASVWTGPALSHLQQQVGTDDAGISWIFVATSIGYITGTFVAGRGIDRGLGHRWWSLSMLVSVAMVYVASQASGMAMLMAALAVLGFAGGTADVGGNTLVLWSRPEGPGAVLNGLHLCFGIGASVAPFLVKLSIDVTDSLWGLAVPMGLVALPLAMWLVRHRPPVRTRLDTVAASTATGARGLHIALVAVFYFAYVGLETGFGSWIHRYTEEIHYGGAATATGMATTFWVAFTAGRVVAIPCARRFSPGWIIAGSMSLSVVAAALFAIFHGAGPMLWVVTALFAVSVAPQYASMMAFAESHLALSGKNASVLIGSSGIGGLLLPWLLGQLFASVGATSLPVVTLVMVVVTALVSAAIGRVLSGVQRS